MIAPNPPSLKLRQGVDDFAALMSAIETLPGVVRPGVQADDEDSTCFDLLGAGRLLEKALSAPPSAGFVLALADYLQNQCMGVNVSHADTGMVMAAIAEANAIEIARGSREQSSLGVEH